MIKDLCLYVYGGKGITFLYPLEMFGIIWYYLE